MDMNCPGPEQVAAQADGRLDAAAEALLLEHCADCDECRRTLALLLTRGEDPLPIPDGVEQRAMSVLRRTLDRVRPRTWRWSRRESGFRAGPVIAAAAGLLVAVAGLFILSSRAPEPRRQVRPPVAQAPPAAEAPEPPAAVRAPVVTEAPVVASKNPEPFQVPAPAPRDVREPGPAAPPPREEPKVAETRVEEAPREGPITLATRALGEIQVTDAGAGLTVRRRGSSTKDRLAGAARLGEGDVVAAEKGGSFHADGRHPVVLGENTSISLAWSASDQAPFLQIRAGEVVVDSTSPTRWVLSDGRAGVVVKPVRGRFAASANPSLLAIAAVSEAIYAEPDGGRVRQLRPGQELAIQKGLAELREDAGAARRRGSLADAGRPRQRTILWTGFDASDAKREQFVVQEGTLHRGEALLARPLPDRTVQAALGPNPRFAWRESLTLRFRYMSNAQSVSLTLRSDERRYALTKTLAIERRAANVWQQAEIPLGLSHWGFRRDDGQNQLTVGSEDRFDSLRAAARQQDVFGDQKAYLLIDDVQLVERD